jgi:hypothetical protein
MSIYTINRYTAAEAGGGLPFYKDRLNQYRFLERPQRNNRGYMQTPNNIFPTFQFLADGDLSGAAIRLIEVNGLSDGTVFTVPPLTGAFTEICLSGRPERFFYTKDVVLPFAFPPGYYYLRFQFGLKFFYSEVFQLGGEIACVTPTITAPVITNGGTGTVEVGVGVLSTSGVLISGTPQLITPSAPGGIDYTSTINEDIISGGSIQIQVQTVTTDFGIFDNYFDIGYVNPDQVTITPKAI